jgi:hypothetical protein
VWFFALHGAGRSRHGRDVRSFEGTRKEVQASQHDQGFDEHRRQFEERFVYEVIANDVMTP